MSSVVQRFEQRLESVVTGAFARAFRSAVQPVEIAAALQREVDNSANPLSRDRIMAPNVFAVELSSPDYNRLSGVEEALTTELGRLVEEHVAEQRYTLAGPLHIDLREATDLSTGRFRVSSHASAAVMPVTRSVSTPSRNLPTESTPAADVSGVENEPVHVEVNGTRHTITPPGAVIGRGAESDLRINDPGISRRHAQLVIEHGPSGTVVKVTDLGSTNGVVLNGQRVNEASVPNGSQILLGNTTLVVKVGHV